MSEPFIGEICIFGFNFAPRGWAFCDGQLLPISQNTALFSLLGTTYGGDGRTTFRLPNLQGAAPLHPGQGPGLSLYRLGQTGGAQAVTLLTSEIPNHQHQALANTTGTQTERSTNNTWSTPGTGRGLNIYDPAPGSAPQMSAQALQASGGSTPHNNMPPYLALNYCIALVGIYPSRS